MKKQLPHNAILIPKNAQCVFNGVIFDAYQWPQAMFDGSMATFEMLRRPDTLQVIAIKDGKLVMVNDEQPNRKAQLHFPGGRADHEGESWLEAAKREMREETGMTFKNWKLVLVQQPLIKVEWFVVWFVATDFEDQTEQELDNGEKITVEPTDYEAVRKLAFDPENAAMSYAMFMFSKFPTQQAVLDAPEFQGQEVDF
jgi:ADP-ribose pyrophosphatase YjhB (NUDIX family)